MGQPRSIVPTRWIFDAVYNLFHPSRKSLRELVAAKFACHHLKKDVCDCLDCQHVKVHQHIKDLLVSFSKLCCDHVSVVLVGPLQSFCGSTHLLTLIDGATVWSDAFYFPVLSSPQVSGTVCLGVTGCTFTTQPPSTPRPMGYVTSSVALGRPRYEQASVMMAEQTGLPAQCRVIDRPPRKTSKLPQLSSAMLSCCGFPGTSSTCCGPRVLQSTAVYSSLVFTVVLPCPRLQLSHDLPSLHNEDYVLVWHDTHEAPSTLSMIACSGFPECGEKFLKVHVGGVPDSVYMDRLKPAHMDTKPVVAQPAQTAKTALRPQLQKKKAVLVVWFKLLRSWTCLLL
ncbi:hypothetical protein AOLI_G00013220 [Acnodon oligacanthus]